MARKPKKQDSPVVQGPTQLEILELANEALRNENERLKAQNAKLFERLKGLQRLQAQRAVVETVEEEDEE